MFATRPDEIWGGTGDDTINLSADTEIDTLGFIAGSGDDTVGGFEAGVDGDVIDISAYGIAATTIGQMVDLGYLSGVAGVVTIDLDPADATSTDLINVTIANGENLTLDNFIL